MSGHRPRFPNLAPNPSPLTERDPSKREAATARKWFLHLLSIVIVGLVAIGLYALKADPGTLTVTAPFLLSVVLIASVWGRDPATLAALASVIVLNYLIVPPTNSFTLPTPDEILRLIGLLVVALVLGTFKDRTLRVERGFRELAAREKLQKTLLNAISHDLKTPLTGVMGSLNVLLSEGRRLGEGDRQELVAVAYDQAKRLDRLITSTLEITRLEAGAVYLSRQAGQVGDVIEDAMAQLRETLAKRHYRIRISAGLPSVLMDTGLLSHAMANIVDNAAKFSAPDASIDIEACAGEGHVLITVADRGIGIAADELDRIFDKFYRGSQPGTAQSAVRGMGLGLAIAKGIVETHGGRIWAEQRVGGGTVIKVRLPVNGR